MPLPPGAYGLSSVSLEAVSSPASVAVGAPPDETGLALPAAQPPTGGGGGRNEREEGRGKEIKEGEGKGQRREHEMTVVQRCL